MRVLCVFCHPRHDSFTSSLAARFAAGLEALGHEADIADLYREGFNPVLDEPDFAQFDGGQMPADVLAEQERYERCDGLALIFPLWWYGMPALLKGWLDRVFSAGWAYRRRHDPVGSLLKPRPCVFLVSVGSSQRVMDEHRYDESLRHLWKDGVLGYVGSDPIGIELFLDATWNAEARARHLNEAYRLGREFGPAR
ncbi:NAD(P)H-dependent oxidoreductase [Aestuariivirga sp.]|uniref:NAD(P)H-dependent oxidoreductase n=1 Tax=Aestuariivirga sp. TaxID=2650926 RepID=UPI003BA9B2D8